MIVPHLVFALLMALVLSVIFATVFRRTGPWANVPLFFLSYSWRLGPAESG